MPTATLNAVVTTSPYKSLMSYGHIIWWSITDGVYDAEKLKKSAEDHKLPPVIVNNLVGADEKSCWEKATNLRTQPMDVREDVRTRTRYSYTTRNIDASTRVLVREKLDAQNVKLGTEQIGVLSFESGFCFDPELLYHQDKELQTEADDVIKQLKDRYSYRINKIDGAKLRRTLQDWLHYRHRVAVRGNGGVYYVPNRNDPAKRNEIINEIMAIRDWLSLLSLGSFTSFEIMDTPSSTTVDLVQSAVDEITTEISEVEASLKFYEQSQGMNAGSRAQSAKSQVNRLKELNEKISALEESLGDKIGVLAMQAKIVARRASKMEKEAREIVSLERAAKGK